MSNQPTVKLDMSLDEINLILDALGRLPYATVYALIARIQEQARGQLQRAPESEQP